MDGDGVQHLAVAQVDVPVVGAADGQRLIATPAPYLRGMAQKPGGPPGRSCCLRLSGEDVRGFLQGLVTNDLDALAPDRPLWAGLLTAQGKALFDFILWADGEDVLIDCEVDAGRRLAQRLTIYRLRRPI